MTEKLTEGAVEQKVTLNKNGSIRKKWGTTKTNKAKKKSSKPTGKEDFTQVACYRVEGEDYISVFKHDATPDQVYERIEEIFADHEVDNVYLMAPIRIYRKPVMKVEII